MSLHAIAYYSSATERLRTPQALDDLLADARRFNEAIGVSGVLLYGAGSFFQYFEGSRQAVDETYARILTSSGHVGIIEVVNEPTPSRHFSNWTMGFAEPTETEFQAIAHAQWKLEVARLRDQATSYSDGLVLLLRFWARYTRGSAVRSS